jgi:hypothetical protein
MEVVSFTLLPLYLPGKQPPLQVSTVHWVPEPVWKLWREKSGPYRGSKRRWRRSYYKYRLSFSNAGGSFFFNRTCFTCLLFHNWPNPSSSSMALGSTQPRNRNEYQESFWGVKGDQRARLTALPPSVSRLSGQNFGASTFHNPMELHGLLQG